MHRVGYQWGVKMLVLVLGLVFPCAVEVWGIVLLFCGDICWI